MVACLHRSTVAVAATARAIHHTHHLADTGIIEILMVVTADTSLRHGTEEAVVVIRIDD